MVKDLVMKIDLNVLQDAGTFSSILEKKCRFEKGLYFFNSSGSNVLQCIVRLCGLIVPLHRLRN